MAKKKQKLPKEYRETPEQRVREEGARFRSRIEMPKTTYNRKRAKQDMNRETTRGGGNYHD